MIYTVRKRDGRKFGFDPKKIVCSIQRAMLDSHLGEDISLANQIAVRIAAKGDEVASADAIQAEVEKELHINKRDDVLLEYSLFRQDRDTARKINLQIK